MAGDHQCSVCQATFTRPQHVARHMRSHTGDRPYKCEHCGDQFARSDLLSRHVNKCHSAEAIAAAGANGGSGRRKALSASTRATTSKQACDQCILSSLPCDGANPCSKCSMRKVRCSFVKFHRQTAPCGPGHLPPQPQQVDEVLPPSTSNRPLTAPEQDVRWRGSHPIMGTPHSIYDQPFAYQAPIATYVNNVDQFMQPSLHPPSKLSMPSSQESSPYQHHTQPTNGWFAWDVPEQDKMQADLSSYNSYPLQAGYTYPPRPSSSYHGSTGSTSSSAASSSLNLPLAPPPPPDGAQIGFNSLSDGISYLSQQARPLSSHTTFSSAFGLLSLERPHAENTVPFFSSENPDEMRLPPLPLLPDTTPTPKDGQAMRDMFKSYLRTPSYEASLHDSHFSIPRRRSNSLPSQKTPGASDVGIESKGVDMSGYQAAVLRNVREPIHLAPPPMRRGSNAAALAYDTIPLLGTNMVHHQNQHSTPLDYSHMKLTHQSQFAFEPHPVTPQQEASPSRPNFKRLASQTLAPESAKRRETSTMSYDYSIMNPNNSQLAYNPAGVYSYVDMRSDNFDVRQTTSSVYAGRDGRPFVRLPSGHRKRSPSTAAESTVIVTS